MSLRVEQDNLSIKLNLENINSYIEFLNDCPYEIKNTIKSSGWDCGGSHGNCKGGFVFTFDGKDYNKCRCGSFVFENIDNADIEYYLQLLDKEISIRCNKI